MPLGALGGLIALHLRGMTLNVSSAVGFIALFGVAVMNGIIMVSNLTRLRTEENLPLKDSVVRGASERFRPGADDGDRRDARPCCRQRSRTASAATCSDRWRRWSWGGLVTATGLTLVWLPALYYLIERCHERPRDRPDENGRALPGARA